MNPIFAQRMEERYEEMKTLYGSLYNDMAAFDYFCKMLEKNFNSRKVSLHLLDTKRLAEPGWFRSNKLMGRYGGVVKFGTEPGFESLARDDLSKLVYNQQHRV